MRREWSGWIRNRDWAELERLAKSDPSQSLTDTVAELERGFTEKADKKALKKILFLLAQRGLIPSEIEEPEALTESEIRAPIRRALLATADPNGNTNIHIAVEVTKGMRWLNATVHAQKGVLAATEIKSSVGDVEKVLDSIIREERSHRAVGEIPFDYANFRILSAIAHTKKALPPTMAYWRDQLRSDHAGEHPTLDWSAPEMSEEELREMPHFFDHVWGWRLELGTMVSGLEWLYQEQMAGRSETSDEKEIRYRNGIRKVSLDAVTEDDLGDYILRLRDIAFVTKASQPTQSDRALGAALSIEEAGIDSPFMQTLVERTIISLVRHYQSLSENERKA